MITDICFCGNKKCKKRKQCDRSLENHAEDSLPPYISIAHFECNIQGNVDHFIKRKRSNKHVSK